MPRIYDKPEVLFCPHQVDKEDNISPQKICFVQMPQTMPKWLVEGFLKLENNADWKIYDLPSEEKSRCGVKDDSVIVGVPSKQLKTFFDSFEGRFGEGAASQPIYVSA